MILIGQFPSHRPVFKATHRRCRRFPLSCDRWTWLAGGLVFLERVTQVGFESSVAELVDGASPAQHPSFVGVVQESDQCPGQPPGQW